MPQDPDRIVPFDIEAEEGVIGSCLLNPQAIIEIAPFLHPDDFYREVNKWVYMAMIALYERREPIDSLTVKTELERHGRLDDVGGAGYLNHCINQLPTSTYAETYARIVEHKAILRRLNRCATQVAQLSYDEITDVDTLLDQAEQHLRAVKRETSGTGFYTAADIIDKMQADMWSDSPPITPLMTGLDYLDMALGGLMPKELTVVAGRAGMGKTSFLDTVAFNLLQAGHEVAFVSLEMPKEAMINRFRRMMTGIPTQRLRLPGRALREDEVARIDKADRWLYEQPLFISEKRGLSISQISRLCRQWYARRPFKVLMIDYIQNIRPDRNTGGRHTDLTEIMLGIYELAGDLGEQGIHIIAASQLSRETERRGAENSKPQLSDLRESGKIEETANIVIGLWRPDYYGLSGQPEEGQGKAQTLPSLALVLKNREGGIGEVPLGWWGERSMFVNQTDTRNVYAGRRAA